jgi:hypothetical protein
LFDIAIIVFVGRATPGEPNSVARCQRSTEWLINSLPVSEWIPLRPMGRVVKAWSRALRTQAAALFKRAK